MKKEFIKKLSIAMTSAMLVTTMAVPATNTASAASKMKISKTSKVLYLNADNESNTKKSYDFNILNKGANYKTKYTFKWTSSDTKVATVKKTNGVVTGKKVGTTTIKCEIKNKKTKKVVTTVSAKVTVKANAETVVIKNAPEGNKMSVGKTFDFNRTMKAANGGKATDKTEWTTSDPTVATVDKNGVVTALKAGKFTVTCRTYQSAKYKTTTAEATSAEITVAPSITEVKQTAYNKINVTFDADMSKTVNKDNLVVTNASGVKQVVKTVKFTGNVAEVELFSSLTDKAEYGVSAAGVEGATTFTASVGEVAKVVVSGPAKVVYNKATKLEYKLLDANGIELPQVTGTQKVEFTSTDTTGAYWINTTNTPNEITIYNLDKVVPVKATYFNGKYDTKTGEAIKLTSEEFSITAVKTLDASVTGIAASTITNKENGKAADWTKLVSSVSLSDSDRYLQLKFTNSEGKTDYSDAGKDDGWTFESTDTSKLVVDPATGKLVPVATGEVQVVCKNGNYTQAVPVTVTAKRAATTVEASVRAFTLSNAVDDTQIVKVTVKDQFGDDFKNTEDAVTWDQSWSGSSTDAKSAVTITPAKDLDGKDLKNEVSVNVVKGAKTGSYQYKLVKSDKVVILDVTVAAPAKDSNGNVAISYGKVKVSKTSFDTKVAQKSTVTKEAITVTLSKYATNSVEAERETISSIADVKITKDGKEVKLDAKQYTVKDGQLVIKPVVVSGSALYKMEKGTYTVEKTNPVFGPENAKKSYSSMQFTIVDTQAAPTVTVEKTNIGEVATKDEALNKVKDCFTVTTNADAVTSNNDGKLEWRLGKTSETSDLTKSGTKSLVVKTIIVTEKFGDGLTVETEVDVNRAITVTVK